MATSSSHPASSPDYWRRRWQEGRTGWHQEGINPHLMDWWPTLELPRHAPVLVPLCGASHDMRWLAAQGHEVYGAESSPLAIGRFFEEAEVEPRIVPTTDPKLELHECGSVHLFCGDFFALSAEHLPTAAAIYDRAALIALPPATRPAYVKRLHALLEPQGQLLLITFEYPQVAKEGPPFSVEEEEVRALADDLFTVELLQRVDLRGQESKFDGPAFRYLNESIYRLRRRP